MRSCTGEDGNTEKLERTQQIRDSPGKKNDEGWEGPHENNAYDSEIASPPIRVTR